MQSIRLGVNYRIGDDSAHISDFLTKGPSALETDRFAFHAQATYVNQYDAPFPAPYKGRNSLATEHRPRDRRRHGVRRRPALEGRRSLGQSGNRSGLWTERIGRRCGISRAAKPTRSAPIIPTRACTGRSCGRPSTSAARSRKSMLDSTSFPDRRPRTGWYHGRKIRRGRYLRYQQIRPRPSRRFHELDHHRHRNVRLRGRRLGLYGRRGGGVVSRTLDLTRRHVRPFHCSEYDPSRSDVRTVPVGR